MTKAKAKSKPQSNYTLGSSVSHQCTTIPHSVSQTSTKGQVLCAQILKCVWPKFSLASLLTNAEPNQQNQGKTQLRRRDVCLILSHSFLAAFELIQWTSWIANHSSLWIYHSKNHQCNSNRQEAEAENHHIFEDSLTYMRSSQGECGREGRRGRERRRIRKR